MKELKLEPEIKSVTFEISGSNPVEALIFAGFFFPIA